MKGSRFAGPSESPGFLLWQVTNAWQRDIRAALAPLDLTHVQFVLLACLAWTADEAPTQRGLAAMARTDEMMTSQTVRMLERKGLLVRTEHDSDARARALRITDAGRDLAAQAVTVVEAVDATFFAPLDGDPALRNALSTLVAR